MKEKLKTLFESKIPVNIQLAITLAKARKLQNKEIAKIWVDTPVDTVLKHSITTCYYHSINENSVPYICIQRTPSNLSEFLDLSCFHTNYIHNGVHMIDYNQPKRFITLNITDQEKIRAKKIEWITEYLNFLDEKGCT